MPPIMEEEEPEIFARPPSPPSTPGGARMGGGIVIEELDSDPAPSPPPSTLNQDKAIVLFNPANPLLMHRSPSSTFSVTVDSDIISGFKGNFLLLLLFL